MKALAMIMAGGESPALSVLTTQRAESVVPFAGKFRIIDFVLSNCVNSDIFNVAVLTQYQPGELIEHVGLGKPWDLDRTTGGVRVLQPYPTRDGGGWQRGTADAIRSNLGFVQEQNVDAVLILAGDHVYKMDYRKLLAFHEQTKADVTLAVREVSPFDAYRFGMVKTEIDGRISNFEEKPRRTRSTLASMGIYVFKPEALIDWLTREGKEQVDFGREVIPSLVKRRRVFAHHFEGYWVDIGTLQAYWEANMALLAETPALELDDPRWVIHTRSEERPPAWISADARVDGNLLCDGCRILGRVERSVISPGVFVAPGALVRDSIIMRDTIIGEGAVVDRAIIDTDVVVGAKAEIGSGDDNAPNRQDPARFSTGLTVVGTAAHIPGGARIGRNCVIRPHRREKDFNEKTIASGETI